MKIGTTALVLDLIERGKAPELEIAQPVEANRSISRDQTCDWIIELKDGRKISAIDVQRIYLSAASKLWRDAPDDEHAWILVEWENVLNDLERDPMSTRDRVDWSAKKFLLDALQQDEKLSWSDPWLQSIDLEYHNLDLDRGLYYELVRKGLMRRVTTEDEIKSAIFNPPETTRAFFRGRAVARFNDAISSIQWDEIVFANGAYSCRVALPEAAMNPRLDALNHAARNGKGLMRRVTTEDEIKSAIFNPPETTRAFFRGRAVARFNDAISSIQWDEIVFANGAYSCRVALPEAAMNPRLDALNHAARNGKDFSEFISAIAQID